MREYATLTPNEREAVRLLRAYTAGRWDIYALAGNPRASTRAHIMSALNGVKTAQAKSGITEMYRRFFEMAKLPEGCTADREDALIEWLKGAATAVGVWFIGELKFPWQADRRYRSLAGRLELNRGYRVLGGDRGDLRFQGYAVDETGTELSRCELRSGLDLTPELAREIAQEIVYEAYASVGAECVEHS